MALIHDQKMYYEKANALKHIYASAQLTDLLLQVTSPEKAEKAVLWLGNQNEYMEQAVRQPKDSTAEVVKDLLNNQVGITIGLWHAEHAKSTPLRDMVIALGNQSVIIEKEADIQVAPADKDLKSWEAVDSARLYFEKHRADIITRTEAALEKH